MRRMVEAAPSMRGVGVPAALIADSPAVDSAWPRESVRLHRLELVLLAAFALVSVWVLGLDLWQVIAHGLVWTGTDGIYNTDQLQYLGWVQSASRSGLVANLFVLHPTAAVFFQPAIAVSGLLTALGVTPWLSLLVWKPVAVGSLFLAVRAYALRALPDPRTGPRTAVIALALFYGCFSSVYGSFGVVGDLFPGFLSWGYPFALMGIAALVFGLLAYDRARTARRLSWTAGAFGALAGLLHPWQGEIFVLTVLGAELAGGRAELPELWRGGWRSPRLQLAAVTLVAGTVPLVYYYALGKLDLSWKLGQAASKHGFPAVAIAVALAPLAAVALLGFRGRAFGFLGRTARVWPLAAVVIYLEGLTSQGATPLHAFNGITLPLAVLAVDGCLRAGWRRLPVRTAITVALIAAFTIPTTYYEMKEAKAAVAPATGNSNFIARGERAALHYLKTDRTPGSVLTRYYLGSTIPGFTGRHTYIGDCIWSEPNCTGRANLASALLFGRLGPAVARAFVERSGARFVLADCSVNPLRVVAELAPLTSAVRRFGCATVLQVAPAPSAAG